MNDAEAWTFVEIPIDGTKRIASGIDIAEQAGYDWLVVTSTLLSCELRRPLSALLILFF
ncbi:hypothetical protein J2R96_005826 [Bradyrhizobium elkanii]|nr:hypothetical protein [Bradyrhizobium elkanii]